MLNNGIVIQEVAGGDFPGGRSESAPAGERSCIVQLLAVGDGTHLAPHYIPDSGKR